MHLTCPRFSRLLACLSFAAVALTQVSCKSNDPGQAPAAPPGATYNGPKYLYGTVGSLTRLNNNQPQLVSGYGLVVDLDGTGSNEVPQFLRRWLINEMVKNGVGRARFAEALPLTPDQLLASPDTAVVLVQGLIPPGAVPGNRFDLLISAADTRTTDLTGGRLWTTSLALNGDNPQRFFTEPLAKGRGSIYVDPADISKKSGFELEQLRRQAIVVAGGSVIEPRKIELTLNQPSRQRARDIADRINERFPAGPGEKNPSANAISPLIVELNIPKRYQSRPKLFIDLIQHLYIDRSRDAVPFNAQRVADKLLEDPAEFESVVLVWKSLGPTAIPVIKQYYQHEKIDVRLAALEAGAFLGDERTSEYLLELAGHESPDVRTRVAEALIGLPESIRGDRALRTLLDDPIRSVRIAAYEAMVLTGSPLIESTVIAEDGIVKMVIDRVPVKEPLIYISQKQTPRLVIFNPNLGFVPGTTAGIWDNQLMIKAPAGDQPAEMFIQYPDFDDTLGRVVTKSDQHKIYPNVATLAYILAHRWTSSDPQPGYDLSYGQVVDAIYQFALQGAIDTEVEINRSVLAGLLEDARNLDPDADPERPETGTDNNLGGLTTTPDQSSDASATP